MLPKTAAKSDPNQFQTGLAPVSVLVSVFCSTLVRFCCKNGGPELRNLLNIHWNYSIRQLSGLLSLTSLLAHFLRPTISILASKMMPKRSPEPLKWVPNVDRFIDRFVARFWLSLGGQDGPKIPSNFSHGCPPGGSWRPLKSDHQATWALDGFWSAFSAHLGPILALFWPILALTWPIWAPSRPHFGSMLAMSGPIVALIWPVLPRLAGI